MSIDINKQIREIYKSYFVELKEKSPELFNREEFSNIFVTGVLDNWTTATNRIMIVGEEAAWRETSEWGDDIESEVDNSQDWVIQFLHDQINPQKYGFKKNRRSFWKRFRKIACRLQDASFCYSNIDSINSLKTKNKALKTADREKLHSTEIRILRKVVKIIKPSLVIFFGWHNISLKHEFDSLFKKVYPKSAGDTSHFINEKKVIGCYEEEGAKYIFTYHPSCVIANTKQYINNEEYEEAIIKLIMEKTTE